MAGADAVIFEVGAPDESLEGTLKGPHGRLLHRRVEWAGSLSFEAVGRGGG